MAMRDIDVAFNSDINDLAHKIKTFIMETGPGLSLESIAALAQCLTSAFLIASPDTHEENIADLKLLVEKMYRSLYTSSAN